MNKSITILLLAALCLVSQADYLGKNKFGIDIFSVNLDLKEEQRFVEVTAFYKEKVLTVLDQYINLIPTPVLILAKKLGSAIYWIQPEYYMEIDGMAKTLGVDAQVLLLAQYINEFSAFCTSIVAYDANGMVFHGRNMDFLFESTMRNITYQGEFYRDGKHLYTAVMYAGLNSVPTGWREGFSVSINNRKPSFRTDPIALLENIGLIFLGYTQNMKLIRDTLEACSTYSCAFNKLSTTP